jgi:hypothetical protein
MLNRVREAWRLVLDGARQLENPERVALAKAKLLEIDGEITRIKNLLQGLTLTVSSRSVDMSAATRPRVCVNSPRCASSFL